MDVLPLYKYTNEDNLVFDEAVCMSFPVFPEAIHGNVHQHRDETRNQHYFAPEYGCKCLSSAPPPSLSLSAFFSLVLPRYYLKSSSISFLLCFLSAVADDDYSIDIYSFGICALEVHSSKLT